MPTLSDDLDLYCSYTSKKAAFTNPDVPFVKIWEVVKTVDFIDAVKTPLFNHRVRTTGTFLCRLEKESYCLVFGNFISLFNCNLCACQRHCHVSIVTTHMCILSCSTIGQIRVIFLHKKSIHICTNGNHFSFSIFLLRTFALDIHNKARSSTFLDLTCIQAITNKSVSQQLLRVHFSESSLWVLVDVMSDRNYCVNVTTILCHNLLMLFEVLCKVSLAWSRKFQWKYRRFLFLFLFFWSFIWYIFDL